MAYKKILFRRDTSSNWASANPVLAAGEIGLESNTNKIKLGNGSTQWNALSYFYGSLDTTGLDALSDVVITNAQNGDVLRWNGTAWVNDPINLGTETVGSYVQNLVAGTGITLTNNSGESATPTVAIGQNVATSSSVQFAAVTAPVIGNASTASSLQTARTIQVSGDVAGSASFDGSQNINITSEIQPNSVALGTDTTGNYMAGVTAGTGIQVSHTPGEGSDATISIGQDVGTGQSVTFAGATIDAIKIGVTDANTIDTTSGNLTIDSSGGTVTIADNLIVDGTLTVSGSVTVVNTTNLQVGDAIITLNHDETGVPSENAGIEIERGTSANVFLRYNETSDKWELTNDGSAYSPIETTSTVDTSLKQQLWLNTVYAATTGVLPNSPSYTAGTTDLNGGAGIGAKLTATTNGTFELDGAPIPLEHRVLVKNQANSLHNGIYKVTATGSASAAWELTRASDFDNSTFGQTIYGKSVRVATGDINALQVFAVTSVGSVSLSGLEGMIHVIGTDSITWTQVSGKAVLIPGNGLEIVNNVLGLPSITQSNTASTSGAPNFVQSVTTDSYGRLIGVTTNDVLIELGAYTTGNYVESISASVGTGITVSGDGDGAIVTVGSNATSANTANSIVMRDESGNFSAGEITAELSGNASTANALYASKSIGLTGDLSGSVSFDGSQDVVINATIEANSVALGTDTTGNYVNDITAGTGITVTHTPGEGTSPTIAIGQAVGTSSSVTFANVTADLVGNVTGNVIGSINGNAGSATVLQTARNIAGQSFNGSVDISIAPTDLTGVTATAIELNYVDGVTSAIQTQLDSKASSTASPVITLAGDLSGSATFTNLGNATLTATIQANSVALGTDTTGNYVNDITAGTGVTVTHTPSEGSSPTIAIGQAVGTSSSVQFAAVTAPLIGNASTASALQTARTIAGQLFDGSLNISIAPTDLTGVTSTAAELNILDGATLSTTELNYVDGVTSAIQTQIDAKAPSASPTFTGVVTLPDNTVALGTKTTGDYVASLVAGTGVTLTNNSGETATPTVAIGQAVGTSASVTFADITVTGILALAGDPTSALHAATKEYVDNVSAGIVAKPSVLGATTTNIDATYANGTLGVGGTLTANSNGVFPSDFGGASGWAQFKGILVKNQTNKEENGRYFISDMGSVSTPYVLTRCGYCDEANEIPGAYIFVQDGTLAGTGWIQVVADPATFVVGTDDIDVFQFSGAGTYLGGSGLVLTESTFNVGTADVSRIVVNADNIDLATTGVAAGAYNSVSVDVYGRVTSASVASYVATGDTGTVTSTMIADGTILNSDINASAGIALSKLATSTAGNIIVYNSSGVPTAVAETGDVTISDSGVTSIASGVIVNADINASAAIAHSKLANATAGQVLLGTTTTGVVTATTISGDITIDGAGVATIAANSVALGTDTTGNYVATITGGTGVTSTAATTGEGTTHTLSIGQAVGTSASPTFASLTTTGNVNIGTGTGDEGGEIGLVKPATNTSIAGTGVVIDIHQNRIRFFEQGGNNRGAFIDLTACNNSVGMNLLGDVVTSAQTASYTLTLQDKGDLVEMLVGSANNLTVPLNSSVAFPIGTQINILQTGTGQTTVVPAGGVTINATPGLKLRAQWSYATLIKRGTDTWVLVGDISA